MKGKVSNKIDKNMVENPHALKKMGIINNKGKGNATAGGGIFRPTKGRK